MSEVFKELYEVDVNDRTDSNQGLTYLSWAWAWAEVKKKFPTASYKIKKFENNLPYVFDEKTGYMVFTEVTIDEQTHEMWLPVMNHNNLAMLDKPYEKKFKNSTAKVDAATMFDINKTIMRCLTKNLAMFGLGLYIYAGEDLPEPPRTEPITDEDVKRINKKVDKLAELSDDDSQEIKEKTTRWIKGQAKVKSIKDIPSNLLDSLLDALDRMIGKAKTKKRRAIGTNVTHERQYDNTKG